MKIKIITLFLSLLMIISVFAVIPASASVGYTMSCKIYYTDESGNTVYPTVSFTVNAGGDTSNISFVSPVIDGYVIKDTKDYAVTYAMMDKYFPASNYVRNGTANYTVVYQKLFSMTGEYLYTDNRKAASSKTARGVPGDPYRIDSPRIEHFQPDRTYLTGVFSVEEGYDTVYYHRIYYKITYDANGGYNAPTEESKMSGISHILSSVAPYRTGYTFLGWSKVKDGDVVYSPGSIIEENYNLTLYAKWQIKTYTVIYDGNGGSNTPQQQKKTYGVNINLRSEAPSRSGYEFIGWSKDKNAASAQYAKGGIFAENVDVTLYAVWEKIPEEYVVRYNANGGENAPANQIKIEGKDLVLSSSKPIRNGYTFKGWGNSSRATTIKYYPGDIYTNDASVTLYAMWLANIYTITYDANGGTGSPSSQKKTHDISITLQGTVPTREGYKFLGWSKNKSATVPEYQSSETYSEEGNAVLYAVWEFINYDFSVSNITVKPVDIYQYDSVTVRFRMDSWDKKNAYKNIPVNVYLDGAEIYSTSADFSAYGVNYVSFELSVGSVIGGHTLEARVNWSDHEKETRTENNMTSYTFDIQKWVEFSTQYVSPNGNYTEGNEVISTFYIYNNAASDILPSDGIDFSFVVYAVEEDGTKTEVYSEIKNDVVCPLNGSNIVFFKWRVPNDSAGALLLCQGNINPFFVGGEKIAENNSSFFSVTVKSKESSQTPNIGFESNPPAGYVAGISTPAVAIGKSTWEMWVYENNEFKIKSYGISVSRKNPSVRPDDDCVSAENSGGKWKIKSGYGITLKWSPVLSSVSGYIMPSSDCYTDIQNVYARFPEYNYLMQVEKYRTLENVDGTYMFEENSEADGNDRIHFIPIYVKNGNYTVSVTATEIWTPAGMITAVRNANLISIDGTIYDDWYQG